MNANTQSVLFTACASIAAFLLGGWPAVFVILVLGILEISLSFDNAVVNASILKNWGPVWRQRFLTWGMLIAVFGMRFIFPIAIVSVTAGLTPFETLSLATDNPKEYEQKLINVHHEIAAFGGVFLLMVFLKFFIDESKDNHWIAVIERPLAKVGKLDMVQSIITLLVLCYVASLLPATKQMEFIVAGIWGLVTYVCVDGIGNILDSDEDADTGPRIVKEGIAGFMYLELLDASFSFDGTIAAFAITNNIYIIMLGLGVGAMFVRSMTIQLVENNTLSNYRYLEHAAFWAIGALAIIMIMGAHIHISEIITGCIGATMIGIGVIHSIIANKKEA